MADATASLSSYAEMTSEIVAAFVAHNSVPVAELPNLLRSVHDTLSTLGDGPAVEPEPAKLTPPVSIRKSVTDEYLISMEDGKQYQSLKRHLSKRGLTPAEYRTKWSLPADYPMTAPGYSARRSELARTLGLGRKAAAETIQEPAADPVAEAVAPANDAPKKRGRKSTKAA